MHRRVIAAALFALAALFSCVPAGIAAAHSGLGSGSAEIHPAHDALLLDAMTLDQAIAVAERRFKARVVRADTQRDGDRTVYVLRLLNGAGRVWTVRVDAQSGQMQ